jgi:predicted nucleic acid-binding protein
MPMPDSFIAATARRHNLGIVTRNVADFTRPGLKVFDPGKGAEK